MSDENTNRRSRTDWAKLAAMDDDDIDTSDIPAVDKKWFDTAELVMPKGKVLVSVDDDVLEWFEEQGPDYTTIMSTALREYVETHR